MILSGVIEEAEYKTNRDERPYLQTTIKLADKNVYVNIVPWMTWRYKQQLEKLGLELKIYFEWDGVDLVEQMFPFLQGVLVSREVTVDVRRVVYQGNKEGLHAEFV